MEQFKQFSVDKAATVGKLNQLRGLLEELGELGLDVQRDLDKIGAALASIESDVLRIALLGAFSDGKTSVVAAWLGHIMSDMKIDMDESSDRLAVYKPEGLPGECEIVDTPGLFGDKEKTLDGEKVMYEDLTRRYISEAHLILYVVDATNPLKESHGEIAKWVLRDLNKLASTVFVINKMDEVTDLTEHTLFTEQAEIKRDNLKSKLQRVAGLSPAESAQLNIVCVAANPNGRGLAFWFSKPEHYESRSRINDLKSTAGRILKETVPAVLIAKTGFDVVRDVVAQKLIAAGAQLDELAVYARQNQEESTRIEGDIDRGRVDVKRLGGELAKELQAMEKHLLNKLRPLSLEDIRGYLEDEIGYAQDGFGYKLNLNIKGAVDRAFEQSSAVTKRISVEIGRQLDKSESFLEAMSQGLLHSASGALKGISQINPSVIKSTIFAARDALSQLTGIAIKFKPWQATKFAGAIATWAGPAGGAISLGVDMYNAYKNHELEAQLKEVKEDISEVIKSTFKDIYDILSNDEKMLDFFAPQLREFERIVATMGENARTIRESREKFGLIERQLKALA
ncbi:LeoA/HP0731 family dynamin-like GTPase [Burkholderia diffusa]|uniref:LeoA/HP0731 family dynamin-like GTPase n=1 Tax=Burkholderia diffusa TaxID=488732 RepID=UPI00075BEEF2|nr:LeoA/HP0731 family dynamin-like GTPase [Burkholderia diffusa]KVM96908.1 GTP-binding protein [Burkholderia diffusa]